MIKIWISIFVLLGLTACNSMDVAPVERRESLYFGREQFSRSVKISRSQSLISVASSYGVIAEDLARANGKLLSDYVQAGELIMVPVADGELRFDNHDSKDLNFDDNVEEFSLVQEPKSSSATVIEPKSSSVVASPQPHDGLSSKELRTVNPQDRVSSDLEDEELAKDLGSNAVLNKRGLEEVHPKSKETKEPLLESNQQNKGQESKQFIWPIKGTVLSRYGKSGNTFKEGVSISAPAGTIVKSAADGDVIYVGEEPKVYGNLVIVKHKDGYLTAYAHCDQINVQKGEKVKQGQSLATVGKTGAVSSPQLHFSVRKDKKIVDPELVLNK